MKWKVGRSVMLCIVCVFALVWRCEGQNQHNRTKGEKIHAQYNISNDSTLKEESDSQLSFKKSYSQRLNKKNRTVRENQNLVLQKGNSYGLMELSRGIGALLSMYEATDSLHYIVESLELCEKIIKKAKKGKYIKNNPEHFKDDYLGWENNNYNYKEHKEGTYHLKEVPLYESYLLRYMSKMIYLIEKSSDIPSFLKKRGRDVFDFIEINGWQKWYTRGEQKSPGCYIYLFRNRTHMSSHWAIVALYLRELTKDYVQKQQYMSFLEKYDKQLKENLHLNKSNAYVWNMTWDTPWPYGTDCRQPIKKAIIQDVSHGNQVITYIVEAYELGSDIWTKNDIQLFSNTVKYVIYDSKNNRFNGDLNGKFIPKVASGIHMADGFVKLSRYDKELFNLFEKVRKEQYKNYKFSPYEPQYVAELKLAKKYFRK